MADCEFLDKCIFFNDHMKGMPSTSEVIKLRYCRDNYSECGRYRVRMALGKEQVPEDMFPNHLEHAQEMIAKSSQAILGT
jgi:hypothetical protein